MVQEGGNDGSCCVDARLNDDLKRNKLLTFLTFLTSNYIQVSLKCLWIGKYFIKAYKLYIEVRRKILKYRVQLDSLGHQNKELLEEIKLIYIEDN
jgi:hypothetical protein